MAFNTDTVSSVVTQKGAAPAMACGKVVIDASITATDSVLVTVGFTPRYIKWFNQDAVITVEWIEGMTAGNSFKSAAAGTNTLETSNGGITICDADGTANAAGNSFSVLQNATLLAISADDVCYWVAFG